MGSPSKPAAQLDLESVPCPLGCRDLDQLVFTGRDRLQGLPGEFDVVRCSACGLMRTNPRPTPAQMGTFYPDEYSPYVSTRVTGEAPTQRFRTGLTRYLELNTQRVPDRPAGRMLEIGCASGAFMSKMAKAGWQAEGVEFSGSAASAARALGFEVFTGRLEDAPDPGQRYDMVVGWMVLEHLYDPVAALRKLWKWTKPGGWLVVSVPNAASLDFRLFGDCWYAAHLPNHLFHYDPRSLQRLFSATGWSTLKIHHQRTLGDLFGSVGYRMQDRELVPRLANYLSRFPENVSFENYLLFPLGALLAAFGQTGRMTVWARRVDAGWPEAE